MIKPSCTREEKSKKKKEREECYERSYRFHITSKKAWGGIRCSSVLKCSAYTFSEEKMNQIVVTLCKYVFVWEL